MRESAQTDPEGDAHDHPPAGCTAPRPRPSGSAAWGCPTSYGPPTTQESIATIHAALDTGITLLDTGDYYAMGDNEMLLRRALEGRDRGVISVKFGVLRDPQGLGGRRRPATSR